MYLVSFGDPDNYLGCTASVVDSKSAFAIYWTLKQANKGIDPTKLTADYRNQSGLHMKRKWSIRVMDGHGSARDPRGGFSLPPLNGDNTLYYYGEDEITPEEFYKRD